MSYLAQKMFSLGAAIAAGLPRVAPLYLFMLDKVGVELQNLNRTNDIAPRSNQQQFDNNGTIYDSTHLVNDNPFGVGRSLQGNGAIIEWLIDGVGTLFDQNETGQTTFTASFWIKTNRASMTADEYIWRWGGPNTAGTSIYGYTIIQEMNTGSLTVWMGRGAGDTNWVKHVFDTEASFPDQTWVHVAIGKTKYNMNASLFLNGVPQTILSTTGTSTQITTNYAAPRIENVTAAIAEWSFFTSADTVPLEDGSYGALLQGEVAAELASRELSFDQVVYESLPLQYYIWDYAFLANPTGGHVPDYSGLRAISERQLEMNDGTSWSGTYVEPAMAGTPGYTLIGDSSGAWEKEDAGSWLDNMTTGCVVGVVRPANVTAATDRSLFCYYYPDNSAANRMEFGITTANKLYMERVTNAGGVSYRVETNVAITTGVDMTMAFYEEAGSWKIWAEGYGDMAFTVTAGTGTPYGQERWWDVVQSPGNNCNLVVGGSRRREVNPIEDYWDGRIYSLAVFEEQMTIARLEDLASSAKLGTATFRSIIT